MVSDHLHEFGTLGLTKLSPTEVLVLRPYMNLFTSVNSRSHPLIRFRLVRGGGLVKRSKSMQE